jgi:hypothetical protein
MTQKLYFNQISGVSITVNSQPNDIKQRWNKLKSGVNWQGALKQKRCKSNRHKIRPTCTLKCLSIHDIKPQPCALMV